ncbi:unnamed protein product [Clonostachys byssicola]|uniref:SMODS and SLOG-associating 2TM effector domain-containing protein n=1 Tax=Clonostachys byssicola TaxID=160290 RepID=A0A9N9UTI7_9HYPO|nr:unnamed protein product [Clonostachys byssicola]
MDERAPLLQFPGAGSISGDNCDHHKQFCQLVGVRPVDHPHDEPHRPRPQSLYGRALQRRSAQNCTYMFTATLINTLLLTQVVLGAALTGLGASNSSRILITVFGALNTIIAGVVAFLKSRGQPMRARMFRDDLSRVVDEIENSAVMWYGISGAAHGYDAIDTDEQVTVRSEVARLTRLYDKAVKTNTMNDPDMYSAGGMDQYSAGLRKNPTQAQPGPNFIAAVVPTESGPAPLPPPPAPAPAPAADPDASPASKAPEPAKPKEGSKPPSTTESSENSNKASTPPPAEPSPPEPKPEDKGKETAVASLSASAAPPPTPSPAPHTPMDDPDAAPASFGHLPKREETNKTLVDNDKS